MLFVTVALTEIKMMLTLMLLLKLAMTISLKAFMESDKLKFVKRMLYYWMIVMNFISLALVFPYKDFLALYKDHNLLQH